MKKGKTPEQNLEDINKFYEQMEKEKEDRLIDLIVEIIVDATLREIMGRLMPEITRHLVKKEMNNS